MRVRHRFRPGDAGSDEISSQIRAAWHASVSSVSVADGRAYSRLARIVSVPHVLLALLSQGYLPERRDA